jgi:hypothetical protein
MHLGEISFCDHVGYNVKSEDFKKSILSDLEMKYNIKIICRHHDMFLDNQKRLCQKPHIMSLRSNGNPYFLYLTRYNDINQCIFIDKKIQQGYIYPRMVLVKFWFDNDLFSNTLLDGEMIKTESGRWDFLLNDLLIQGGVKNQLPFTNRIQSLYHMLKTMFQPDVQDICQLKIKRFFEYSEYDDMLKFCRNLEYTSRGVYFTPEFLTDRPILMNFDDSLVRKNDKTKLKNNFENKIHDPLGQLGQLGQSQLPLGHFSLSGNFQPPPPPQQVHLGHLRQSSHFQPPPQHFGPPPPPPPPPPPKHFKAQQTETFLLQKTNNMDIYNVYSQNGDSHGVACVNTIETSRSLKEAFSKCTPVDKLKYVCTFNVKFGKWTPIITNHKLC